MEVFETWALENDYVISWVKEFPKEKYLELFNEHMLMGHPILPWREMLSDDQKNRHQRLKSLVSERFVIKLALFHKGEFIGWSYGWQDSNVTDFYVGSSLIVPEHRNKGLYSKMSQKLLAICEREGFSAVRSSHICTNNPILIAKLKLGFMINGLEQNDTMGTLVQMIYHFNELRRKGSLFRAGKYSETGVWEALNSPLSHK